MRRAGLVALFCLGLVAPAQANYQVRGTFLYRDREFDLDGFTGVEPNRPIRFADVEVAAGTAVLARGATDASGAFTLQVVDNQVRDVTVRVRTSSTQVAGLYLTVRRTTDSAIFAVATPTYPGHSPTQNIDFTANPIVAVQGGGGDAFNIYDVALDGMDFVADIDGLRPGASQSLTLYWASGSNNGTRYEPANRAIYLLGSASDSDAFDDSVILHEFGHYVEFVLAASDNPSGEHTPNSCLSLQLAWSEGYSTFLQNLVRDWQGLSNPEIYVDTTGQPGSGQARLWYEVESPSYGVPGAGNEITVNATLWDMFDQTTTQDATPGSDDDPMRIADARARFWDVLTMYLPLPFVTGISIEDFWDGWFYRGHGAATEMQQVFAARGLEFSDDAFEPDDSFAQARTGGTSDSMTHHTIYGAGDSDWTRFDGTAGRKYVFETRNLLCGTDTDMLLWAANGTTLLAHNDDQNPGNLSSRIEWTPTTNGTVYLQVRRAPDIDTYGSYDLNVDIGPVFVVTDVAIVAGTDSVHLTWRSDLDPASHFDVERADAASGPWLRRNPAPIAGIGGMAPYAFVDTGLRSALQLYYRLVAVENDGNRTIYGPFEVQLAVPAHLVLYSPQPNPFAPPAAIRLDLPGSGPVTLSVYDLRGRVVRRLVGGEVLTAGTRTLLWDGRDDAGNDAAAGIYWLRLETAQGRQTRRAVLLR